MMGSRETANLYVLSVTQLQAEMIAGFCQQRKWNIQTFVCIPTRLHGMLERAVQTGRQVQPNAGHVMENHSTSTVAERVNEIMITVDGTEYQEIGIFDEVLKLRDSSELETKTSKPVCCTVIRCNITHSSYGATRAEKICNGYNTDLGSTSNDVDGIKVALSSNDVMPDTAVEKLDGKHLDGELFTSRRYSDNDKSDVEIVKKYCNSDTCEQIADAVESEDESNVDENSNNENVNTARKTTAEVCVETIDSLATLENNGSAEGQLEKMLNNLKKVVKSEAMGDSIVSSKFQSLSTKRHKGSKNHASAVQKRSSSKLKSLFERRETLACEICGKVLASVEFYKRHLKLVHSEEAVQRKLEREKTRGDKEVHVCLLCKKQFVGKNGLRQHEMYMHSGAHPLHQCHQCGAVLKFKGSLATHMRIVHSDRRPHQCNICPKKFKSLQHLKNHRRRHDPDYVETCTVCGKTVSKGHLSSHLRRHSETKEYQCDTCLKTFYERHDLNRHMRVHSGERPYKCPHCPYMCAVKGNMTKHVKHKHEQELGYPLPLQRHSSMANLNKKLKQRKDDINTKYDLTKEHCMYRSDDQSTALIDRSDRSASVRNSEQEGGCIGDAGHLPYQLSMEQKHAIPSGIATVHTASDPVRTTIGKFSDMDHFRTAQVLQEEQTLLTMRPVAVHVDERSDRQYASSGMHTISQGREPYMSYLVAHVNEDGSQYTGQYS